MHAWLWVLQKLDAPGVISEILASFKASTDHAPNWAKAWHQWALFNVAVSAHYRYAVNSSSLLHLTGRAMSCVSRFLVGMHAPCSGNIKHGH